MSHCIAAVLLLQCYVGTLQSIATGPARTSQLTGREILPNDCGIWNKTSENALRSVEQEPWQVGIMGSRDKVLKCGGSIISKYHVLTAAQCFMKEDVNKATPIPYTTRRIVASCFEYGRQVVVYDIKDLYIHDSYSYNHSLNDIALLKINGEFSWSECRQPLCLPAEDEQYTSGLQCRIPKFQYFVDDGQNNLLRIVQSGIVIMSTDYQCIIGGKKRQVNVGDGMFCGSVYLKPGVMAAKCQYDLGEPLYCGDESMSRRVLFGISSTGNGCHDSSHLRGYTKVFNYLQWIRDRVEERGTTTPPVVSQTPPPPNKPQPTSLLRDCGVLKSHTGFNTEESTAAAGGIDFSIETTPWLAALMYRKAKSPRCSGAIISIKHVLTTVRCPCYRDSPEMAHYIFAGDSSLQERNREYNISRIIIHPEFNNVTVSNNIALIEISGSFTFSDKIQPICMPYNELYKINRQVLFVSWYQTRNSTEMRLYRKVNNLMARTNCSETYNRFRNVTNGMMCSVASVKVTTEMRGVGGAPLIANEGARHYLLGVFSWRPPNSSNDAPDVHTNVLNYIQWIKEVMTGVKEEQYVA